jgi:Right handed beta helix region
MKKIILKMLAAAILMVVATPAMAQATRTWISGVGDDVNPCSRTAPCKTFAGAISKTAAGGEINCLDPGGFGTVTITKSITLRCGGADGGVLAAATNGITINAASTDRIVIDGLDIEGAGTGLNGVRILSARDVLITNTAIRGFTSVGSTGVLVANSSNTRVVIRDSYLANNETAVKVAGAGPGTSSARIYNSTIYVFSLTGVSVSSATDTAYLSGVEITGGPKSLTIVGGTIYSYGNNVLNGVTTDAPTSVALQ